MRYLTMLALCFLLVAPHFVAAQIQVHAAAGLTDALQEIAGQ